MQSSKGQSYFNFTDSCFSVTPNITATGITSQSSKLCSDCICNNSRNTKRSEKSQTFWNSFPPGGHSRFYSNTIQMWYCMWDMLLITWVGKVRPLWENSMNTIHTNLCITKWQIISRNKSLAPLWSQFWTLTGLNRHHIVGAWNGLNGKDFISTYGVKK